jgi:hypothetical protein
MPAALLQMYMLPENFSRKASLTPLCCKNALTYSLVNLDR